MGHIFMSYSRRDTPIVDSIVARLEKAGVEVWIDREDIESGRQWRAQIVEAIDTADAFVISLSENAAGSVNVLKELNLAEDASDPFVVPVMLQDIKIPAEMRYQLAGVQRITYYLDPDQSYQELEYTLLERQQGLHHKECARREIEIVIQGETVANFSEDKKQQLLALLAEATGTPIEQLAVTRIELGSVHVFVDAPQASAYALKALALNRDPRLLQAGIDQLRFVGDRNFIALCEPPAAPAPIKGQRPNLGGLSRAWLGLILGLTIVAAAVFGLLRPAPAVDLPTPTPTATVYQAASRTPTTLPTRTATGTATPVSPATSTASATASPTPSPTSGRRTPTATQYLGRPMVIARTDSVCRAGPGRAYPIAAGDMRTAEEAFIRWRDATGTWFQVWLERLSVTCWVSSGESGTVDVLGDISGLPVYVTPSATPLPPTPTYTATAIPTQEVGSAMVTGVVWADNDNNQTVDGFEDRLMDVTIRLWKNGCGNGIPWTTQTDTAGEYVFTNLPEGNFCLEVVMSTLPTPVNFWDGTTHANGIANFLLTDAGLQVMFGFADVY